MLAMGSAYLDLMEKVLAGTLIQDPPIVTDGLRDLVQHLGKSLGATEELSEETIASYNQLNRENGWDWPSKSFSMIGLKRLRNFRDLIGRAIAEGTPGDILETGVWRGGASILARATLMAWSDETRRVFVADSFEGLPPPSQEFPQDSTSTFHNHDELAVSLETVQANFAKFDLLDERVVFLKGWFKDTMPQAPIDRLAVLRLDGDMYQSTIEVLSVMYDKVSPGGWIIVDDYFLPPCKAAVTDFLAPRSLTPEIVPVDEFGVYFRKC